MKKSLIVLLVFVFTVTVCTAVNTCLGKKNFVNSQYNLSDACIVIDAGHGGADAGTVAADGTLEKDINLAIALDLYDFLNVCGIECVTIRNGDYEFYPDGIDRSRSDLYNRLDFVNETENAVLVSIHQNFFTDSSEHGMQVWYTANEKTSKVLADNILNYTKMFLQQDNTRQNKQSDNSYYILYNAQVPSVMVECGFMSNAAENEKLNTEEYQKQIACTIMLGINEYIYGEV